MNECYNMPSHAFPTTRNQPVSLKIGHFSVRNGAWLRYATTPRCPSSRGTVLILIDHGESIEQYRNVICQLQQRRFSSAIFDWFGQGGSDREHKDKIGGHISDFRDCLADLSDIFFAHFLPSMPAPFYVLSSGMGGLFAFAAHNILKSQIRRLMVISPLLQPMGHPAGGRFHRYARLMSDLGFGLCRTNTRFSEQPQCRDPIELTRLMRSQKPDRPIGYPTLGLYATMLDAAQYVLSPPSRATMSIPTLCILSDLDNISPPAVTRHFMQDLRSGSHLILRGAPREILRAPSRFQRQFWSVFDAFIPGSGAPSPERSLEEGLAL